MSGKGKFIMYAFLLILAVILLRNAAGTVGILIAGGAETNDLIDSFQGGTTKTANKGTFTTGKTKVKLG